MDVPERPPKVDCSVLESFDDDVRDLVRRYNERYLHWSDLKYRDSGTATREQLWTAMKLLRAVTAKSVRIGELEIRYNLTDGMQKALHDLDMRLATGIVPPGHLDERRRLMYSISSMMEESIASSQMEGAATTTVAAKRMLRMNASPSNRSERMIVNNYRAIQYIREHSGDDLSPLMILRIHSIVSDGTLDEAEDEGRFRTDDSIAVRDVFEDVTYHMPPSHERIGDLVEGLCEFANDDSVYMHPIVKGIVLHFLLAYIHPFVDGNGRVSRSLFYWFMLRKGYPAVEYLSISKVMKDHRGRYDRSYLLSETDDNDITYFIGFNLETVSEATEIFLRYAQRKVAESQRALEDARTSGLSLRQRDILTDLMKSEGCVDVEVLAQKYMVSTASVRRDLLKLVEAGLAEQVRTGHRKLYRYLESR